MLCAPKNDSTRTQNQPDVLKAKGVKKTVLANTITYDDYYNCLFNKEVIKREQNTIRSVLHQLRTEKQLKVSLSSNDDKRFIIPGSTDTLPWGHWRIADDEIFDLVGDTSVEQPVAHAFEEPIVELAAMAAREVVVGEETQRLYKRPLSDQNTTHSLELNSFSLPPPSKKTKISK